MSPRALLALSLIVASAHAMWYKAGVVVNGANQVPPVDTSYTANAVVQFNSISGELTWYIEHDVPPSDITAVHFHGPALANGTGDIQIDTEANYDSPMQGSYDLNANQTMDILNGLYYINVHTNTYPLGEIRGQIYLEDDHIKIWEDQFDHDVTFYDQEDGHYRAFWTLHEADQWIEMGLAVQTEGWVGFGISRNGDEMVDSDIVIGWVRSDGQVMLEHRYRETGNGTPRPFEDQTYIRFIGGFKQSINGVTTTYLHFEKAMNGVRGDERAVPIKYGMNYVIWGVGYVELGVGDVPTNHGVCDRCREEETLNFNLSSAAESGTAWYAYFGGVVIALAILICGICAGYWFGRKGCCENGFGFTFPQTDTSVQKKQLLEKS